MLCFSLSHMLGDHKGDEVDSRLLFKINYCSPDCTLPGRSQGSRDEQQQLDKDEVSCLGAW